MRDDDVDAAAEGVLLRPHADAAEDGRAVDRRVDGEVVQVLEDLRRELARRRETSARVVPRGLLDQLVEDRQQERGRLAAAGHGAGEDVAALERRRNGVGLDRGRPGETEVFEASEEVGVELELAERH